MVQACNPSIQETGMRITRSRASLARVEFMARLGYMSFYLKKKKKYFKGIYWVLILCEEFHWARASRNKQERQISLYCAPLRKAGMNQGPHESISDREVNSKSSTEGGLWASMNAVTRRTLTKRPWSRV